MTRFICFALALLLAMAPITASAGPRGGGGARGGGARGGGARGGGARSSGGMRSGGMSGGGARTMSSRPSGGASRGGYNFNRDASAMRGNSGINRAGQLPNGGRGNLNGNTVNRGNFSGNTINRGAVVANPVYSGPAWGWNGGVAWAPAGAYWGGGFWGALAIGATQAAIYGSMVNTYTHETVTSYEVEPSSPGSTLLSNYQLTQTQCGAENLVVIYGPNDSLICAHPNNVVAAGTYTVDASNLSLVSENNAPPSNNTPPSNNAPPS